MNEDSPFEPTKQSNKQGWWFLASVMIGCTICVPVFVMGATLAHQLPYSQFVTAALLGGTLAAFIALITGIVGQRTGLPTAMIAKITFGKKGYILANLAMAIAAIGWFGIQIGVFSTAFVQLGHQVWGIEFNKTVVAIISGLIMSTTAIIGFRGLGKLSYISVPLLIVLLLLPLYIFYTNGQLADILNIDNPVTITMGTMIAMVGGAYSFACTMPDTTRFMRSQTSTALGVFANFVLAYPLLLILTGSVALAAGQNDYMQVMISLGFGAFSILVLFLATWTTNDTNVYAGALSMNLFLPKLKRWKVAAGVGLLGTVFAVMGIFEHFVSWLIFSGNLFAPMAGVYVADYWLNTSRYNDVENIPQFRGAQIMSWLLGTAVGPMTTPTENMGFGLISLTSVPMLDSMLTAVIFQVLFHYILKKKTLSSPTA